MDLLIHLEFLGVISLDLKKSYVNFKILIIYEWKDPNLAWNPATYGNKENIVMKTKDKPKIWTPEL